MGHGSCTGKGATKVKVKVHTLDIVPLRSESPPVWHVFSRDLTVLPAHPHVHPQAE